jgi:prevent-host-death family protein
MKSVSITELKAHLSKYVRVVVRGGEVQVLERGVPVARLVAVRGASEGEDERFERLVRAGLVRRGTGGLGWLLERDLPTTRGASVSAALDTDREDRF